MRFPIMLFGGGAGDGTGTGIGTDTGAGDGMGGGGGGTGDPGAVTGWRAALTGEYAPLAADKTLADIKGENWEEAGPILAKTLVSSQKMLGDRVVIPKPGQDGKIDPKAQRDFWTKVGVPLAVDGYKDVRLDAIEGVGPTNQALIESSKPEFLKLGLTPSQAQGVLNLYATVTSRQRREMADAFVEQQAGLEEKWGLNFDNNFNLAKRALNKYFGQDFMKFLADSQLDLHPAMIEGFYNIGKNLAEGRFIEGSEPTVADQTKLEEDIKKLREEMQKMNQGTTAWRDANTRLEAMYKQRYGTAEVGPTMQRPA